MTVEMASWPALGTTAHVVVTDPAWVEVARAVVEHEVAAIDAACSRFRDDAELARVHAAAGEPVEVSPLLAEAIAVALDAAQRSGGLVDPTIGAGMIAAGYDRDFAALPRVVSIRPAVAAAGWRTVRLDRRRRLVALQPGTVLDLGATAKALAADRAAAAAAGAVTPHGVLVSLGGDVAIAGPPPEGGWPVGVGDAHDGRPDVTVALRTGGLATSTTTQRRWRRRDRDMHHILDPFTGRSVDSVWTTATVAADSCVMANTASTAAILMGAHGPFWLERLGLPARLVHRDGSVVGTCGWVPDAAAA